MDQRVSLITLGVTDMDAAATFYDALGWQREDSPDGIVTYNLIGQALGLYPRADLARDMGVELPEPGGFTGMTLSCNVRNQSDVSPVLDAAKAAGGTILKEAHDVFWGGHIGYFADLDGHVWEVAYNPFSPLREDGAFRWGGYGDDRASQ